MHSNLPPGGGSITIQLIHAGAGVQVQVIDTGVGIAREDQPYIFERYKQLDGDMTPKKEWESAWRLSKRYSNCIRARSMWKVKREKALVFASSYRYSHATIRRLPLFECRLASGYSSRIPSITSSSASLSALGDSSIG